MPVYDITPAFGAMLILMFYVTLLLVGLSVIFAIIADSLFRERHDKEEQPEDHFHEEDPVGEVWREIKARFLPKKHHHHHHHKIAKDPDGNDGNDQEGLDGALALTNGSNGKNASNGMRAITGGYRTTKIDAMAIEDKSTSSGSSSQGAPRPDQPTEAQLRSAIEHMSGRILGEVSVVGIEIKSELHDVCERVAQMQMAVEELSWRSDRIREEQAEELGADAY